ncbi:MAG TPA: M13-type metalloendopeptidase [Caulobacteraceae bacterium]|nr:M13-type metalloendopeptidase [Caulobacteraceae bacterium]
MKTPSLWPAALAAAALAWPGAEPAAQSASVIPQPTPGGDAGSTTAAPHYGAWGFDAAGRDPSVPPGQDFFRYANGDWVAQTEIPSDRPSYGVDDKLAVLSETRAHLLIESAAAGRVHDVDATRISAAYKAFMDERRVNALGAAPLAADLDAIRNETSREDVAALMGTENAGFQDGVFNVSIGTDSKAPTRYAVYVSTGGLGLPDRDYYLKPAFAAQKAAYRAYIASLLTLAGWPDPDADADAIVAFESKIAEVTWTRAERRDPDKTYHLMSVDEVQRDAPGFEFHRFLASAELGARRDVVVRTDTAMPKVAAIFAETPLTTLKAWQAFHVVDNASPFLAQPYVEARFDFRNKTLAGQPQLQPRWKRGVAFVDRTVGESVGRLYVAKYFTPQAKAEVRQLVFNLRDALKNRIEHVAWMSPETKAKALTKLSMLTIKIGYPLKWRDYSALSLSPDDLYGDARRSAAFEWERQVHRLDGPVDKAEWVMTPQTVNAYYNPTNNEVVFPAAILQPPFFDPHADAAINYGGIGAVIGHEMTHGFDDQGRKYDGEGRLTSWWTAADGEQFEARAKRLGEQYDAFEPVPGAHVKGELTMGENIADLGGVLIALDAYHASLHGRPAPVIGGLTGDQRFFLGYAQAWRDKERDDYERQLVVSDPHSPARFRVDGVVRNVDAWYAAFDVKSSDPMYLAPDHRVRIW